MADTVLDGFAAAAALTGAEEFICVQSAAAVNPTATQIQTFAQKLPIEAMPTVTSGAELVAVQRADASVHAVTALMKNRLQTDTAQAFEILITTNSTTSAGGYGAALTAVGTISHPTVTTASGRYANIASSAAGNQTAGVSTTSALLFMGNAAGPFRGWSYSFLGILPDASYNNTGASTGKRIFLGVTDQTFTTPVGSDNPSGNHAGFFRCHVNGGLTHTNWQFMTKDNTTINIVDTGLAFTATNTIEALILNPPGSSTIYWAIRDVTAGTAWVNGSTSTNVPQSSALLRPGFIAGIVEAVAVNIGYTVSRIRGFFNQV